MKKLTREQLIRRLHLVREDLQKLDSLLKEHGIDIYKEDGMGCGICTYLTNIEICVDVDDDGLPIDVDGHRVESEWKLKSERYKG